MKKIIALTILSLLMSSMAYAQHCGNCPHHQQHAKPQKQPSVLVGDNFDQALAKAFPLMKSTKNEGKWTAVYDANKKLLGYAANSKPASDGIKGYNGETPVMIAFDKKKKITGVYLLANTETPRFAHHVQESGFYNNWNGLSVKKALKKQVDTVSGATYTSRAVIQSVQAVLATL